MINIQVLIVSYRKLIVQLIIELLKGYPLITFEIKTTDVYHRIPITPTSSVVVIDLYQFNQKSIEQRLSLYSKNTLIVILKPDESPIDSGTTPYVDRKSVV